MSGSEASGLKASGLKARLTGAVRFAARLPSLAVVGLIRVYQLIISPLSGPSCKYYPSCSAYAVTAVRRFGLIKGTGLALWRLARCNPWSRGGVDHVPQKGDGICHRHGRQAAGSSGTYGAM